MLTEQEREILKEVGLSSVEDIDQGLWVRYVQSGGDPEVLRRVARVSAVNQRMVSHGLAPLTDEPPPSEGRRVPCACYDIDREQFALASDLCGLTVEEYVAVRGGHACVMGLFLCKGAAVALRKAAAGQKAKRLTADQCQPFLCKKLKRFAAAAAERGAAVQAVRSVVSAHS